MWCSPYICAYLQHNACKYREHIHPSYFLPLVKPGLCAAMLSGRKNGRVDQSNNATKDSEWEASSRTLFATSHCLLVVHSGQGLKRRHISDRTACITEIDANDLPTTCQQQSACGSFPPPAKPMPLDCHRRPLPPHPSRPTSRQSPTPAPQPSSRSSRTRQPTAQALRRGPCPAELST